MALKRPSPPEGPRLRRPGAQEGRRENSGFFGAKDRGTGSVSMPPFLRSGFSRKGRARAERGHHRRASCRDSEGLRAGAHAYLMGITKRRIPTPHSAGGANTTQLLKACHAVRNLVKWELLLSLRDASRSQALNRRLPSPIPSEPRSL